VKSGSPAAALVLRTFDYGESSLVLHLLTREEGRIHGIAKGARRLQGDSHGGPDLLTLGVARVYPRKPESDLRVLGAFRATEDFPGLRGTIARFHAAQHVAALVLAFTREEQPHPELFDLTVAALRLLESADDGAADALALGFEAMSLRLLGFAPELSRCVVCGKPARNVRTTRLSALRGGLLCTPCRGEDARAPALSGASVEALRGLAEGPLVAAAAHAPAPAVRREIRAALDRWTEMHLDRPLGTSRPPS
jgi:DNA repair protein RecO (recombination protein O)